MQNQENDSTIKIIIGVVVIAIIAIGVYLGTGRKSGDAKDELANKHVDVKSVFNAEQTKAIEEIVVKVAREQNDVFMKAINEGMQLQQEKAYRDREKNVMAEIETVKKNSIVWGDPKAALQVYAMIDPMCPHCHDFMRTAVDTLGKTKNIAFTIVVAPILGANSVAVSKVMLAANIQSADKSKVLMGKFVDKVSELTREKLIMLVKESGIDDIKFKVDEESITVQKQLEENVALFEKLKIPGVPTVFLQNKDGVLVAVPPLKTNDYVKLAERAKAGEDISKPPVNADKEEAVAESKKEEAVAEPKKEEVVAESKKEEAKAAESKKDEVKKAGKKAEKKADKKAEKKSEDKKAEDKKTEN